MPNPKKPEKSPVINIESMLAAIKHSHGIVSESEVGGESFEDGIADIITFCESPQLLNLPTNNMRLWLSQRIVLKSFYMGTRGNRNIKLTEEEWKWLYENDSWYETKAIIEKLKVKESRRSTETPLRFSELNLVMGRRSSKTAMASIIAAYEAYKLLTVNNGDPYGFYQMPQEHEIAIINVANSQKQAGRLYFEIQSRIRNSPFFAGRVASSSMSEIRLFTNLDLKKKAENLGNIDVQGSIVIVCGHSNPKTLVGYAAICIIFDELAYYDELAKVSGKMFYEALIPSIAQFSKFNDGIVVELSTPGPKTGIFYQIWKASQTNDTILSYRFPTWVFNPQISYDDSELVKGRNRDKAKFDVEFGAEWPEGGYFGLYFPEQLIDRAIKAGIDHGIVTAESDPIPGGEYYFHLDPALSHNNYALVCVRKEVYYDGQQHIQPRIVLSFVRVWVPSTGSALDYVEIDNEVIALCRRFRPAVVGFDAWNSAGSIALMRRHGITLAQNSFNRGYKNRIFQNLRDLMNKDALWLYEDNYLTPELRHLKYRPTPRGVSIGADIRGDIPTDDCADCLAGAAYLASGNYYVGLPAVTTVWTGYR